MPFPYICPDCNDELFSITAREETGYNTFVACSGCGASRNLRHPHIYAICLPTVPKTKPDIPF
jgi:transcription elongation factor Elf1